MSLELLREALAWSAAMNLGILVWWFLFITLAADWVYRVHSRFLPVTREQFNVIHYAGMTVYKICIFTFFIVPYLALRIIA